MRTLRVVLPVLIVVVLGGFMLSTWLDPLRILARSPLDPGKMVISGTKITMQAPKLSGYTRDSRSYDLIARSAAQDITNPNIIELHDIQAKIEAEDKSMMDVTAKDGVYDRKAGILSLARDIVLKSTSGYEVFLSEAVIDTGTGEVVSKKPVEVRMLQGVLNANGVEVLKSGEIIIFEGQVVMNLPPGSMDAGAARPGQR